MLTVFLPGSDGMERIDDPDLEKGLPGTPMWIDLIAPDDATVTEVERQLSIDVPDSEELGRIETSSRLIAANNTFLMTYTGLSRELAARTQTPVTCILTETTLLTIRQPGALAYDVIAKQFNRAGDRPHSPQGILFALLGATIDRLADRLAHLGNQIDTVMNEVFGSGANSRRSSRRVQVLIKSLGWHGSHLLKVQDSLVSLQRLALFLRQHADTIAKDTYDNTAIATMVEDLRSLSEFAEALDGKVEFLLDAMLGLIDLDQNQIMKIISMLAAMFLPATLISSIFGMNFRYMPELAWHHGFLLSLGVMGLSAVVMAFLFRWRRWM